MVARPTPKGKPSSQRHYVRISLHLALDDIRVKDEWRDKLVGIVSPPRMVPWWLY